jgi:hypothetical protein
MAFKPGRHILEGVVIFHETIHEMHSNKMDGILLKIDFEKAYDKVNWDFLQQALCMNGFDPKWCQWVQNFVSRGSVGVRVNNDVDHYFQTKKGLRQGDPLSPILFNIIADMLAIIINRAKEDGQVEGIIPHLVEGGVSLLQYANDTIIFMQHDLEKALNMKHILYMLNNFRGLRLTFTRTRSFVLVKLKRPRINTYFFLVVRSVLFLLNTLVYLFISQVEEW